MTVVTPPVTQNELFRLDFSRNKLNLKFPCCTTYRPLYMCSAAHRFDKAVLTVSYVGSSLLFHFEALLLQSIPILSRPIKLYCFSIPLLCHGTPQT